MPNEKWNIMITEYIEYNNKIIMEYWNCEILYTPNDIYTGEVKHGDCSSERNRIRMVISSMALQQQQQKTPNSNNGSSWRKNMTKQTAQQET